MKCEKCNHRMVRNGKTISGVQRYYCKQCKTTAQENYTNKACMGSTNTRIVILLKEGVGIRGIARVVGISTTTVLKRIVSISKSISKPPILFRREYEMDEMYTYIGNKNRRICIAYAIDRRTRNVVGFTVGRRNKTTLGRTIDSLLLSEAKQIRTDRNPIYLTLIPKKIHHVKKRGINYIERKNLTLRTHIKRLNRRTIAYSKSMIVLSAILKIYFWHKSDLVNVL